MKQGIYYDIPEKVYHSDPCVAPSLSASIAKIILQETPLHAWHAHPRLNSKHAESTSDKFDIGKAIHSLMTGDDRQFVIVKEKDWRKDAAKEAKAAAYREGKTPLLEHRYKDLLIMADAARKQLDVTADAANAFVKGSRSEATLVWQEGDIWCRIRIDNCAENGFDFYDFKSTAASANPANASRLFFAMGYDITEAFYRRGIKAVLGIDEPTYRFILQEIEAPHALSVIGISPESRDMADRKAERAIQIWSECTKTGIWPGYPTRTAWIDAPKYHQTEWLEREELDAFAAADTQQSNQPTSELLFA